MTLDTPWLADACALVDAYRAGELTPTEALDASLEAIDASELNTFAFLDADAAREAAADADVSLPLGGVPVAVKELDKVKGWPDTEASLVFADRVAPFDNTAIERLRAAGAVLVGLTTASEFGGLNIGHTKLHGITGNPWNPSRTPGGSSAGSASAVAGGLVPLATGGDGGGSIRIPAAFCGLVGMKGTAGRIPRGPHMYVTPMTVLMGCLSRSVRDVARYFDNVAGYDSHDPYSLPTHDRWEADLGAHELRGKRAVIAPTLGSAMVRPEVEALVRERGEELAKEAGLQLVDVPVELPGLGFEWAMTNLVTLLAELGERYPECQDELTTEIAFGLHIASEHFDLQMAAAAERARIAANEAMADLFDHVDLVLASTNPDVAFPAEVMLNTRVGELSAPPENNGALTIPANICGNPAVSIPAGFVDELPVGLQVIGRHHEDALLLDLALAAEHLWEWPQVAPGAPV